MAVTLWTSKDSEDIAGLGKCIALCEQLIVAAAGKPHGKF
jgi:hypothetical protein